MITCVYSIELRPVELALEQLRRAANAAERILDLVREAADELAVGLLLLVEPLLARDLELLVDVAELEQQAAIVHVDRRDRAREVQPRLGRRHRARAPARCTTRPPRRALSIAAQSAAQSPKIAVSGWPVELRLRQLEQILRGGIGVADDAVAAQDQHRGREQLEARVRERRFARGRTTGTGEASRERARTLHQACRTPRHPWV